MDDEIGDALAVALDAIAEHAGDERYSEPTLAAWIESTRDSIERLQTFLAECGSTPR